MHPLNLHILDARDSAGAATIVLAHGYGCDQSMWHEVAHALPETRRILFDWPGAGHSDPAAYDAHRHATLDGYADDLLALMAELGVPWHGGTPHGPSNHLLDSQVQCVNALFPMVAGHRSHRTDGEGVVAAQDQGPAGHQRMDVPALSDA